MTAILCSRKQIKKKAREILFSNYQTFLFATLFFAAVSFGFTVLSKTFCELLCEETTDEIFTMVSLTFDIFGLLLCFPFALGYLSLCAKLSDGRKTELSEMFTFYSKGGKLTSCYAFLLLKIPEILLKLILPFIALSTLQGVITAYFAQSITDYSLYISAMFFVLQVIVIFAVFYMEGGILLYVFDFCRGTKHKHTFSEKRTFFIVRLSLIPLYILSVLTFGVLLLAYTLPYTLIIYALYASKSDELTNTLHSDIYNESFGDTAIFKRVNADGESTLKDTN